MHIRKKCYCNDKVTLTIKKQMFHTTNSRENSTVFFTTVSVKKDLQRISEQYVNIKSN